MSQQGHVSSTRPPTEETQRLDSAAGVAGSALQQGGKDIQKINCKSFAETLLLLVREAIHYLQPGKLL